jgi:hypothetical protein
VDWEALVMKKPPPQDFPFLYAYPGNAWSLLMNTETFPRPVPGYRACFLAAIKE